MSAHIDSAMTAAPPGPSARRAKWLRFARAGVTCLLLAAGVSQVGHAGYILAKAKLAQALIARAWDNNLAIGQPLGKPWAWADTAPVAQLHFVRQRESMIVLAGDSGRILAFGPGHNGNTPLPGDGGNSVISGHRDTHFAVLRYLQPGDLILVQNLSGNTISYEVEQKKVVDQSAIEVTGDNGIDELTLVTCWPFDAITTNGPERLVVSARRSSISG